MPCPSAVEIQSTFTNAAGIAKSPLSIARFHVTAGTAEQKGKESRHAVALYLYPLAAL